MVRPRPSDLFRSRASGDQQTWLHLPFRRGHRPFGVSVAPASHSAGVDWSKKYSLELGCPISRMRSYGWGCSLSYQADELHEMAARVASRLQKPASCQLATPAQPTRASHHFGARVVGKFCNKTLGKYVINSRGLRFAEFVLKALPAQARRNACCSGQIRPFLLPCGIVL